MSNITTTLAKLFAGPGASAYLGESVTIAQHMLQAAALAASVDAAGELIVAALLHDIGHLTRANTDPNDWHRGHDQAGGRFLEPLFGLAVTEPVRLHVKAKRYLCAVDDGYHHRLSPASVHTLGLQGGAMSQAECRAFEADTMAEAAVSVRRFDEGGKALGRKVPPFDAYCELIDRFVRT